MYDTQQIKQRISCVDYAKRIGLPINRPGDRCISPLRSGAKNKTSFFVDNDFFYDFSGGLGGDVITFCAEYAHNGDRGAAILELAKITGTPPNGSDENYDDWHKFTQNLCSRTAYYHTALTEADRDYLHSRRISDETIDRLMIGRVTDTYLKGRLWLPYFTSGPEPYVCYYATRYLPGGTMPESKYAKAKKHPHLQHIPWGMQTINRDGDTLIIAEGYFDAVSFEQEGYPVISAITGRFPKNQISTVLSVARNFKRVLITYDNDPETHAGEKFTVSMARILMREKIPFVVGHTPDPYHDISDYYAAGGDLRQIIRDAEDGVLFLCRSSEDYKKLILSVSRFRPEAEAVALVDKIVEARDYSPMIAKQLYKIATSPPSETFIVDELLEQRSIIYINNDAFYEWNDKIWERKDELAIQGYINALYGKKFATAARVGQTCKLLKIRALTQVEMNKKSTLTFTNGTLELESGKFREFRQDDYASIIMTYPYEANAKCPRWDKFIQDVTDEDGIREEALQMIAGYVLFPDCKHQKIFAFMGAGGNGKSVYLDVLQEVFGSENCTTIDPMGLCEDFKAIHLKNSLLNYAQEIDADFSKAEKTLKTIADGKDIQACYKGQDHIIFRPRCKLIFSCNAVPQARTIAGMDRRMYFIGFPCKFVEDPDPKNPMEKKADIDIIPKLLEELSGIFNWVYEGYRLLNKYGCFMETYEQEEYMRQFREASNPVEVFVRDYDDTFEGEVPKDSIYHQYCDWCEENNHMKLASSNFFIKFKQAMGNRILEEVSRRENGGRRRTYIFKN